MVASCFPPGGDRGTLCSSYRLRPPSHNQRPHFTSRRALSLRDVLVRPERNAVDHHVHGEYCGVHQSPDPRCFKTRRNLLSSPTFFPATAQDTNIGSVLGTWRHADGSEEEPVARKPGGEQHVSCDSEIIETMRRLRGPQEALHSSWCSSGLPSVPHVYQEAEAICRVV